MADKTPAPKAPEPPKPAAPPKNPKGKPGLVDGTAYMSGKPPAPKKK